MEDLEESPLRRDAISGGWTVLAPGRKRRPHDSSNAAASGQQDPVCAFCQGNERLTPPEVDALRGPDSGADEPGWTVRTVPNKYPALPGGHEVVVHSPDHERDIDRLGDEQTAAVMEMYGRRLTAHLERGARAVTIAYNRGASAGASLAHPHSQVFATSIVPPRLLEELDNFQRFQNRYGGCLLCEELEAARRDSRMVFDEDMVAWIPAAPMGAYQLWLAPAAHAPDLRGSPPRVAGRGFRRALAALLAATSNAPLNGWLHTAPADLRGPFHWHMELLPRLSVFAGFELGSGITICETDPVEAAEEIRAQLHH